MVYILTAYIIFLLAFIIYSAVGIYHLWRFGYVGDLTKPVVITYSVLALLIIIMSIILISLEQWPTGFSL